METDHVTCAVRCVVVPGALIRSGGQVALGISRCVWAEDGNKMFLVLIYPPHTPRPSKPLHHPRRWFLKSSLRFDYHCFSQQTRLCRVVM